jgi:hypothetical protein
MTTGKKAGSAASSVLRDPKATPAEKRDAGSDLAQRPCPSGGNGKGK